MSENDSVIVTVDATALSQSVGGVGDQGATVAVGPSESTRIAPEAAEGDVYIGILGWEPESAVRDEDGVTASSTENGYVSVAPTSNGVQIVSAITSATAPTVYAYTVSLPIGTTKYESTSGAIIYETPENESLGKFESPWAVDALGRSVPTWFEFTRDGIQQIVDHTSDAFMYPILADPQWSYSHTAIPRNGNGGMLSGTETPWDVYRELKSCFSCSFPVAGAPKRYPTSGQLMNLNASPFSFINVAAPVRYYPLGSAGSGSPDWYFVAQAGHFDGAGSRINFDFYKPTGYPVRLAVSATIKVDKGGPANASNTYLAKTTWNNFINNLIRNIRS